MPKEGKDHSFSGSDKCQICGMSRKAYDDMGQPCRGPYPAPPIPPDKPPTPRRDKTRARKSVGSYGQLRTCQDVDQHRRSQSALALRDLMASPSGKQSLTGAGARLHPRRPRKTYSIRRYGLLAWLCSPLALSDAGNPAQERKTRPAPLRSKPAHGFCAANVPPAM